MKNKYKKKSIKCLKGDPEKERKQTKNVQNIFICSGFRDYVVYILSPFYWSKITKTQMRINT